MKYFQLLIKYLLLDRKVKRLEDQIINMALAIVDMQDDIENLGDAVYDDCEDIGDDILDRCINNNEDR